MGKIEERFRRAGLKVKKLESIEDIKNNSWVLPNSDKEGMIKFKTNIFIKMIRNVLSR